MPDEPIPFYPAMRCHMAPLPPGSAPVDGCDCRICQWGNALVRGTEALDRAVGPIRPDTPEWRALMVLARD